MRPLLVAAVAGLVVMAGCSSSEKDEAGAPDAEGCPAFPRSSHWNRPVDDLPVHSRSEQIVDSIGRDEGAHADFGSPARSAFPTSPCPAARSACRSSFEVADESDPGPYPIPRDAPIEGGPEGDGDRHVIVVDRDACRLYELFSATPEDGGDGWRAGSGATWNLKSNAMRPEGWTSADAAGLPIFPGLARPDEVEKGKIDHALRITVPTSRQEFVYPARHYASDDPDPNLPAMGERLRLKESFDVSGFPRQARVVLQALKTYGAIVADNGSPWFISGVPSGRWDDDDLQSLKRVPGSAWEVVDSTRLDRPEP